MPAFPLKSRVSRQKIEDPVLRSAFAQVYRENVDTVYRYLLARVGCEADAQDLTEQTFVSALNGFASFRGESRVGIWLLGIARHKLADHLRKHYRERVASSIALDDAERFPADDPTPDDQIAFQLQIERASAALKVIAPDRAEALALHFFGGLSTGEVALVMGRRESAVKMLIHRGLADLRVRLNSLNSEEPA